MTSRRVRLVLEDADPSVIERLVASGDAFDERMGAFYGAATTRLAPLLGADRRVWLLRVDGAPAGFLDADLVDDVVWIACFVAEPFRRRGVASGAVGRLLGLAPWPHATRYRAAVDPRDLGSREVLRATGFRLVGTNDDGDLVWERAAPRARPTGTERFLDAQGRIDRYPVRAKERAELLEWVAAQALPPGQVWTEPEINERLLPLAPGEDVAVLRRYLVDAGLLERTRSGSSYARPSAR